MSNFICLCLVEFNYYPGQKEKRTIAEICGKKYAARSCDIMLDSKVTSDQCRARSSATICDFCPALIARDQA